MTTLARVIAGVLLLSQCVIFVVLMAVEGSGWLGGRSGRHQYCIVNASLLRPVGLAANPAGNSARAATCTSKTLCVSVRSGKPCTDLMTLKDL